ncbi:MAG: hypothetical protein EZS28_049553, partial [Streblomastix strix]
LLFSYLNSLPHQIGQPIGPETTVTFDPNEKTLKIVTV